MACTLGKSHQPPAPASDMHHVIPQAWQRFWQPAPITGPGGITMILAKPGDPWDPRTVEVCPNHHRLTHEAIVAMMHAGAGSEDPAAARHAAFGKRRLTSAEACGLLALTRWRDAGGSLEALRAAREWGEQ